MSRSGAPIPIFERLKDVLLIIRLSFLSLTILQCILLLALQYGNIGVNIALLVLAIAYGIFLMIMRYTGNPVLSRIGRRAYRYIRLLINGVGIAGTIYSLVVSASHPNAFAIIVAVISLLIFCAKVTIELIILTIEIGIRKNFK